MLLNLKQMYDPSFPIKEKWKNGYARNQIIYKTVLLCLVVIITFVVKRDYKSRAKDSTWKLEFDHELRRYFQEPQWMLPVKQADGSYGVRNLELKDVLAHLENKSDCGKMNEIHKVLYSVHQQQQTDVLKYLNSGWTKTVYKFHVKNSEPVAVKVLDPSGEDVLNCFNDIKQKTAKEKFKETKQNNPRFHDNIFKMEDSYEDEAILGMCRNKAKLKLLKEAYLMDIFDDANIVKLRDVCLSWEMNSSDDDDDGIDQTRRSLKETDRRIVPGFPRDDVNIGDLTDLTVSYSTQLGSEADLISLLQLSWEDRLRVCHGISRLLKYFSSLYSPLNGSVLINDFRRQQFVLVDGDVMMTDLDDLTFDGRSCNGNEDCRLDDDDDGDEFRSSSSTKCSRGKCHRWHDAKNTRNAGIHFVSILLPHNVPEYLMPLAKEIINNFSMATWRTENNHNLMENLVRDFSSGVYLARVRDGRMNEKTGHYKVMDGHDLPGQHDYRCQYTRGAYGCSLSVHDEVEAKTLCDMDVLCRGFVMSPVKSWTGRRYVHFKSNVTLKTIKKAVSGYVIYYKSEL